MLRPAQLVGRRAAELELWRRDPVPSHDTILRMDGSLFFLCLSSMRYHSRSSPKRLVPLNSTAATLACAEGSVAQFLSQIIPPGRYTEGHGSG